MKKLSIALFLISLHYSVFAQTFNGDGTCNPGVNGPVWSTAFDDVKRATFLLSIENAAGRREISTGILVNQRVNGQPRQLFLTSRHSIHEGDNGAGPLYNLSNVRFVFNYQSPDGNNVNVPADQHDGSRYRFDSPVNLIYETPSIAVGNYTLGTDIALLEIVNTIPPHFQVYFAGWSSRGLQGLMGELDAPYQMIHHPNSDVKKIAQTYGIQKNEEPVANTCREITKTIDAILDFFGFKKSMSEILCNYVDIPQYLIPIWQTGGISHGTSGSATINKYGLIVGINSASIKPTCDKSSTMGKFINAYATRVIRDNLNPAYDTHTNLVGLGGRNISCYATMTLSGNYYPAREYQPQNRIFLSSSDRFTLSAGTGTNQPLTVFNGADFVITAANQISLQPGFTAQLGSTLSLAISPCNGTSRIATDEPIGSSAHITEEPVLEQAATNTLQTASPNPFTHMTTISYTIAQPGPTRLLVSTILGKEVASLVNTAAHEAGEYTVEFDGSNLPAGMYIYSLQSNGCQQSKRLVIVR